MSKPLSACWRRTRLFLFAPLLFAAGLAVAAGPKAGDGQWLAELSGGEGGRFTAYPQSLGWQADHPASYPGPFLVVGMRPAADQPKDGVTIRGARQAAADWVITDGSGAVWVTGLPAPAPEKPLVLSGRFATEGGLVLKGIRFLVAAEASGKTLARPGDFIFYPLAGNKSTTVPVEIEGDAAVVAFTDQRDALIVRAIKPGSAKIKFFSLWFTEKTPKLQGELLLAVE